jgi:hypothetical protein
MGSHIAEGSFAIEMPGGWVYRGKTDLLVREKKTKKVVLVEHKTAGRLDASYVAKLPLDNQILGYAWAKGQEKIKVDNVLYNVTKMPQIRLKQSESMAHSSAGSRRSTRRERRSTSTERSSCSTGRAWTSSPWELKKFQQEVERCQEENYYYQNTSQCTAMGVCEYMPICSNPEGLTKDVLMLYRVKDRPHEELPKDE